MNTATSPRMNAEPLSLLSNSYPHQTPPFRLSRHATPDMRRRHAHLRRHLFHCQPLPTPPTPRASYRRHLATLGYLLVYHTPITGRRRTRHRFRLSPPPHHVVIMLTIIVLPPTCSPLLIASPRSRTVIRRHRHTPRRAVPRISPLRS